jgi:putative flippase GtrA
MVNIVRQKITVAGNYKKYLKFQLTALTATVIDFYITILLKEIFLMHYTLAVAGGALAGAAAAFIINRFWVFRSFSGNPFGQMIRYILVAIGSILLNTAGTWLLTELFQIPYLVSKATVALVIGFTYSYYFSKRFVFYA